MDVIEGFERARGRFSRPVVTMGNFDGVHRGHQAIIERVCRDAEQLGVEAVALTFDPHPMAVLKAHAAPSLLMLLDDRLEALAACGLDAAVVQKFTPDFAAVEAHDFIARFFAGALDVQQLVLGHDVNFGRDRMGSAETLVEAGAEYGFTVEVIPPVVVEGTVVHSSAVRETIGRGDVAAAARFLGRPYLLRGRVEHGAGRGKEIGFATANVEPAATLVPGEGVYASRARLEGRLIDGVTSIGRTPTFDGTETVIESHLFEQCGDLYGAPIAIEFVERLRDQEKFSGSAELAGQIKLDVERAKTLLATD